MAHIELESDRDGEVDALLEATEDKWGYVPEIVRALALHPPMLAAENDWTHALMHDGYLDRALKEAVAATVSAVNDCSYCAASHAFQALEHGVDTETIDACRALDIESTSFGPAERSALAFARSAATDMHAITADDLEELLDHFSRQAVVELVLVIASFQMYNTFVTLLGLEVEQPLLDRLRGHGASVE